MPNSIRPQWALALISLPGSCGYKDYDFHLVRLSLRKSFFAKCSSRGNITTNVGKVVPLCYMEKWGLRDSNPGPAAYEAAALTD